MKRRFRDYIRGNRGCIACVPVVIYALLLAVFLALTWVEPLPRQYPPDFGRASWIQLPKPDIAAYFRKTLYIPNPVDQAWLMVSATGNYDLYVNGVHLDDVMLPCARPSGIYDIKSIILPGKNVIGIHIAGGLSPDVPQIRVRGAYRMVNAPPQEFFSDSSWRAAETPDGVIGSFAWTATNLDDTKWTYAAEAASPERYSTVQPLSFDPRLLAEPLDANWITAGAEHGARVSFRYDVNIANKPQTAWLQVASNGGYTLLVNGRAVVRVPDNNRATLFGPQATIQLTGQTALPSVQMPDLVTPSAGVAGNTDLGFIQPAVPSAITEPISAGPSTSFSSPVNPAMPQPTPTPTPAAGVSRLAPNPGQNFAPTPTVTPTPSQRITAPTSASSDAAGGNLEQPALPAITSLTQPLNLSNVTSGYTSALTMPGLASITPAIAPVAPQPAPLDSTLGAGLNVPVMTAFDISRFVKTGGNQITVVASSSGTASIIVEGFIADESGKLLKIASGSDWGALVLNDAGIRRGEVRAIVTGHYGSAPWGPLPQVTAYSQWTPGEDARAVERWTFVIALTLLGVIVLWWVGGTLLATEEIPPETLWNCDAVIHAVMAAGLLLMLLTTFDARLAYDWCFKPAIVLGILLALIGSKLILVTVRRSLRIAPEYARPAYRFCGYDWQWFALGGLMLIGLVIRAWGLTELSMSHDEVSMVRMSQGILHIGFPYMRTGTFIRYPATYEIVPYPLAFFGLLLGPTTMAYRMPALIFGTLAIGLIGVAGYRMMSWRVGLVAAAIFTFLPSTVLWSRDAFYCSQESFLQLLTIWLFYEAIRGRGVNARYIVLTTLAYIATYFSWEGSGFLIVALFFAILFYKWGEWDWIWNGRLWTCVMAIAVIIALQFSYRQLVLLPEYLGAGKDLNDLSTPQLALLDRLVFNPYFYFQQFFLTENNTLLFLLVIAGLLFAWRERALFYLYIVLAFLVFLYTCFLGYYAPRYSFNWTGPLVLAATGTLFYALDRLAVVSAESRSARAIRLVAACLAVGLLGLSANPYLMKLYRLAWTPAAPAENSRLGAHYMPDYRSVDLFVARHLQAGDGVACPSPHVFLYDTGRAPDYSLDTMLIVRRTYDGGQPSPHYIDRSLGVKLITTLGELDRARMSHRKLWVIQRNANVELPAVTAYLRTHGRVAYESDEQSVVELDGLSADGFAER
jgi:hypothetical protein